MKARLLALIVAISALAAAGTASAGSSTVAAHPATASVAADVTPALGTWHRLSEDRSKPAPEHQRLTCLEGVVAWACVYDKIPEPTLNFFWNGDSGVFVGRKLTAADGWTCPSWFPAAACNGVTEVI